MKQLSNKILYVVLLISLIANVVLGYNKLNKKETTVNKIVISEGYLTFSDCESIKEENLITFKWNLECDSRCVDNALIEQDYYYTAYITCDNEDIKNNQEYKYDLNNKSYSLEIDDAQIIDKINQAKAVSFSINLYSAKDDQHIHGYTVTNFNSDN